MQLKIYTKKVAFAISIFFFFCYYFFPNKFYNDNIIKKSSIQTDIIKLSCPYYKKILFKIENYHYIKIQ